MRALKCCYYHNIARAVVRLGRRADLRLSILANEISFLLMSFDKLAAERGTWRIPERWFFMISLAGGALAVLLGMFAFHHKTSAFRMTDNIQMDILLGNTNSQCLYC